MTGRVTAIILFLFLSSLIPFSGYFHIPSPIPSPIPFSQTAFRVMFYNVENLFDTLDNPDREDDEFTPEGSRRWTNRRYYNKINNLAKVISSVGEWGFPTLVGICEVENEKTLKDLCLYSPLKKAQYRYLISDSEDIRGINIALLYQRDRFRYLSHESIPVSFPHNPNKKTRDILYVSGMILSRDTLDVFVCHFPSRRDGQWETEQDRVYAASVLKAKTDSLFKLRAYPLIIIMGDFNDEPGNKSLDKVLQAKEPIVNPQDKQLYNLLYPIRKSRSIGSYKYRSQWNFLDQIIVSGTLLNENSRLKMKANTTTIFQPPFILAKDATNGGMRPKKTYHGYKYEGGYSDHLPVYVDFESQ